MLWVLVGGFGGGGSGERAKELKGGFCGLLLVSVEYFDRSDGEVRSIEV